jgi:hypothetical protein
MTYVKMNGHWTMRPAGTAIQAPGTPANPGEGRVFALSREVINNRSYDFGIVLPGLRRCVRKGGS